MIVSLLTKGSFPIIPDNNGLERKGNQGLNPKQRIVDTKVIDNYLQGSPSLFPGEDSMVGDNNYSSGFQSYELGSSRYKYCKVPEYLSK